MKDGEIARTTKELEDLLMANEKKQKSPMEELLAEMESAVARVETVSYTHLDVYKRQLPGSDVYEGSGRSAGADNCGRRK